MEQVQVSSNNKRIAKNTSYLYLRMILVMGVGLYTSRIVLSTLGVSDYGINNVMSGIIGMLVYVNTLLSGASSRFITIDLGKGDTFELKKTFSMTNTLAVAAAIVILVLGETVGLWFMMNKLNIDPGRMDAAGWVYQCALFTCCLSVLQTPYQASIIAHEKMDIYAYMSVFDVIMKIMVVYLLLVFSYDKLKLYAVLNAVVSLLNFIIYRIICVKRFDECSMSFSFEANKFKAMLNYSSWNMLGALANVLNGAGLNILINIFFGTIVNAARGIAQQASQIVTQFYSNFQMASRPQIMKYYAQNDITNMSKLICNSSKYCAYLLLCIIIPIFFNVTGLLMVWLGQVPPYTSWFVRLMLLQILFQAIDLPIGMGIHAVGKMVLPNITATVLYLSVFPVTYLVWKFGAGPIAGYAVYLSFTPFILLIDLWILHKYTGFNRKIYVYNSILPIVEIAIAGSIVPAVLHFFHYPNSLWVVLIDTLICGLYVVAIVYYVGLPKHIRKKLIEVITKKMLLRKNSNI